MEDPKTPSYADKFKAWMNPDYIVYGAFDRLDRASRQETKAQLAALGKSASAPSLRPAGRGTPKPPPDPADGVRNPYRDPLMYSYGSLPAFGDSWRGLEERHAARGLPVFVAGSRPPDQTTVKLEYARECLYSVEARPWSPIKMRVAPAAPGVTPEPRCDSPVARALQAEGAVHKRPFSTGGPRLPELAAATPAGDSSSDSEDEAEDEAEPTARRATTRRKRPHAVGRGADMRDPYFLSSLVRSFRQSAQNHERRHAGQPVKPLAPLKQPVVVHGPQELRAGRVKVTPGVLRVGEVQQGRMYRCGIVVYNTDPRDAQPFRIRELRVRVAGEPVRTVVALPRAGKLAPGIAQRVAIGLLPTAAGRLEGCVVVHTQGGCLEVPFAGHVVVQESAAGDGDGGAAAGGDDDDDDDPTTRRLRRKLTAMLSQEEAAAAQRAAIEAAEKLAAELTEHGAQEKAEKQQKALSAAHRRRRSVHKAARRASMTRRMSRTSTSASASASVESSGDERSRSPSPHRATALV